MKINPKSQKGAITLIMTVTMLFLTAFLMTLYIRLSNKASISAETTSEIAKKYDNTSDLNSIYSNFFTDSNIIPITTKEELVKIGSNESITINGKIYKFEPDGKYVIMNDIDLGAYDETNDAWDSSKAWDNSTITLGTDGVLDGLGYTITGLYINNASSEGPEGLFGTLEGTVRNLNIKNSYIKGNQNVGAIAGTNNGTIENCSNSGTVIGKNYIGGITGNLSNNVINCTNIGTIIPDAGADSNMTITGGYLAEINDATNQPVDIWSKTRTLSQNYKFISGQDVAIIPQGFKVSANVDEQTISQGMVIQDSNENEFVWIPVPDISKMAVLQTNSTTNYRGVLYDFDTDSTGTTTFSWSESSGNREPANLISSSDNIELLPIWTETLYQTTFNTMVESIRTNGGFYVGRYEMSLDNNGNAQSKNGLSSATAAEDSGNQWYGLYAKAKTFSDGSVTSEMIWGCQYDAIINWMIKVGVEDIDGYHPKDVNGNSSNRNTTRITGSQEDDKVCNIYDLLANSHEWTQEASGNYARVHRSGTYNDGGRLLYSRITRIPGSTNNIVGTRMTLYIKSHSETIVPVIPSTGVFANNANIKEVREGNIPIPTGFDYIKGDLIGGAVIRDFNGNEFVWIPVPDITKMAVLQTGSSTNYRGVLYNWNQDASGNTEYPWSVDNTSYREPSNLQYDNSTRINGWTENLFQTNFNNMVSSVSKYGGFYISRYEMSKDDSGNAQSKAGVTSVSAAATTAAMPANGLGAWYGLYNLTKKYTMSSVTSDMIWGCQFDAMQKWMVGNGIAFSTQTPVDLSIGTTIRNTNSERITGAEIRDKLCNIYDLLGCRREWTQEANVTAGRVFRSGTSGEAVYFRVRSYDTATTPSANRGTRFTLYIN